MPTSPRTIVITGATRGLGRALVDSYVAQGHRVIGCGRSSEAVGELKNLGATHHFSVVDVASDAAVAQWANTFLTEVGTPDLLINNAAVMNTPANLWETSAEEFDSLVDVNIKGIANVIRHVVPAMVKVKRGVIVNLSSGWGRSVSAGVAPYCATKWAVEGLTRALANELPAGMAAVPLNPGIIDTDMLRLAFGDRSSGFGNAQSWAVSAAPFLLGLSGKDNGKPLTVPGQ